MSVAGASLTINIVSLIIVFFLAFSDYKKNNFIAVLYWVVLTFLVLIQGIFISSDLLDVLNIQYLGNNITPEGHLLASFIVLAIIVVVFIMRSSTSAVSRANRVCTENNNIHIKDSLYFPIGYYIFQWFALFVLSVSMIYLVGGLHSWLASSRPGAEGGTVFLVLFGLFTYPLLLKLSSAYPFSIKKNDILLYAFSVLIIASFSRILFLFHFVILVICLVYNKKSVNLKKYKKHFILSFLVFIIIFFVYGAYRDVLPQLPEGSRTFTAAINLLVSKPELSILSFQRLYHVGIEGMSGVSGVLSQTLRMGTVQLDFGMSLFTGFFHLIPGPLRSLMDPLPDYIASMYWYHGSVVGGGLENIFVHFSFLGFILYPFILYYFSYVLEKNIRNNIKKTAINDKFLIYAIYVAYGLQIIRGTLWLALMYIVAEICILYMAIFLFRIFIKKKPLMSRYY
ncbi:hypothetical protein AVI51_11190 [Piscirickettsia salmonis]|uniref:Uncharacterized protein n=1 Tax=Piscirickettsia salmonis TaxID=1238 RepID=A0A9Q5YI35_PISSA|nr:O-antigen polymerase [Piscirickettsia salmonis]ALA26423.1 membrane protein [Piscirickettsia salmonis]APS43848.1 hypothetical protein AVI48_05310 [Piscirickettsia salmonis]APS47202.1 hypothetical protein AVI49_05910 [Piscirickettsia salmonis]APS51358.1 hypothetical protein AVI50_11305 [Piscirickettsia salmonis]APS54567.1 hypothetical protein AVI51_11190 [Piscirickettsia salmonis]